MWEEAPEDRWFQPQLGSWASGCAATLRGCCCGRVPVLRPSLCVSAFSCPIKMNQLDSLNYNMNIKLSKETHFPRTQEAGPQHTHTETALGVFPKGIAAPSWSELSVERGSCPDGPGRQPAAEVSSNRAKGKCLSLHDRSQPSLPPCQLTSWASVFQIVWGFLYQLLFEPPGWGKPQIWF